MSLFSAITGKKQSKGGQLLERLGGAERLEDRREAIAEFKDLTSRQPVRLVFEGGIGVLLNLLRGEDTDTHRDALEMFADAAAAMPRSNSYPANSNSLFQRPGSSSSTTMCSHGAPPSAIASRTL